MNKRIIFIGCVESSRRLLERLVRIDANVVGVITKESSSFNADFADLTPICRKNRIPFICVKNANDENSLDFVKAHPADIAFCFGWSQLLKPELINAFPEGVVGFHPAALPNNKGRHPNIWAVVLGLENTASSFFMIDEQADHGAIISQRTIAIDYSDDAQSLYDKIMDVACDQEEELVSKFEEGRLLEGAIENTDGNVWRKRGKADGQIDWRMSTRAIYNLVRGLTHPYVGAHLVFNDADYKIWRVAEEPGTGLENIEPGMVLKTYPDGSFDVKAYDGVIRVLDSDPVPVKEGEYL